MVQTVLQGAQRAAGGGNTVDGGLDFLNGGGSTGLRGNIDAGDAQRRGVHIAHGDGQLVEALSGVANLQGQAAIAAGGAAAVSQTQLGSNAALAHILEAEVGIFHIAGVVHNEVSVVAHGNGEVVFIQTGKPRLGVFNIRAQAHGIVVGIDGSLNGLLQLSGSSCHGVAVCNGTANGRDLDTVNIHVEYISSSHGLAVILQRCGVDTGRAVTGTAHDDIAHHALANVGNCRIAADERELGINALVIALNGQLAIGSGGNGNASGNALALCSVVDNVFQLGSNVLKCFIAGTAQVRFQLSCQRLCVCVVGPVDGDGLSVNFQIVFCSGSRINRSRHISRLDSCGCHSSCLAGSNLGTLKRGSLGSRCAAAQRAVQQLDAVEVGAVGDTVDFGGQLGNFLLEVCPVGLVVESAVGGLVGQSHHTVEHGVNLGQCAFSGLHQVNAALSVGGGLLQTGDLRPHLLGNGQTGGVVACAVDPIAGRQLLKVLAQSAGVAGEVAIGVHGHDIVLDTHNCYLHVF